MLRRSNSGDRLLFFLSLSDCFRRRKLSLLSMLVLFLDRSRLSRSVFLRSALDIDFLGLRRGVSIGDVFVGLLYLGRLLSRDISERGRLRRVPLVLWSFSG